MYFLILMEAKNTIDKLTSYILLRTIFNLDPLRICLYLDAFYLLAFGKSVNLEIAGDGGTDVALAADLEVE